MTHLDKDTLKDLMNKDVTGSLPLLIRVKNPGIYWSVEEKEEFKQEDGYINLASCDIKLKYKNKTWLPCVFSFNPPLKDGTKQGAASISIMALDARVTSLLQVIDLVSEVEVIAAYLNQEVTLEDGTKKVVYKFVELNTFKMFINSAFTTGTTANFNLSYMNNLQQVIPYDAAISLRVPAGAK